ncbi:MAG: tRNA preQ1(34) S-adenosylmethionine ribosyltransferase-isomerase QueA [Candidatus Nanoarchaeia archaeon]
MRLSQFTYKLPKSLIAQSPIRPRDHSRLLVVDGRKLSHRHFFDIADYFEKGDILVLNETKVSRAKITGKKTSGSPVELIIQKRIYSDRYECRVKGHKPKVGDKHVYKNGLKGEITGKDKDIYTISFNKNITKQLTKRFALPLPPYITQKIRREEEYQTSFARKEGSVAAPTAGFHFTPVLLNKLKKKGVKIVKISLHIDFGTFIPIEAEDVTKHKMRAEYFEVSKAAANTINKRNGRLFVVGTTCVRALESAADRKGRIRDIKETTDLYIYPGYRWKTRIDALITNFHLPKSTLLLLVSAFIGRERLLKAYQTAVRRRYRFYSFGDSILLFR